MAIPFLRSTVERDTSLADFVRKRGEDDELTRLTFRRNSAHCPSATARYGQGALSQDTAWLMVFKLVMAAAKTWRRLKGENQLSKVVQGVTFRNGVEVTNTLAQSAA